MPAPHLASLRLGLRPFGPEDAPALLALWSLRDVRRSLWDDGEVGRDLVADVIVTSERDFDSDGFGFWIVSFAADPRAVGFCGFRHEPQTADVELVYGVAPEHWGQGLATEAAASTLLYAFDELGIDEVVAGTDAPNRASVRVLEKLGMVPRRRSRGRDPRHERVHFSLDASAFRRELVT